MAATAASIKERVKETLSLDVEFISTLPDALFKNT